MSVVCAVSLILCGSAESLEVVAENVGITASRLRIVDSPDGEHTRVSLRARDGRILTAGALGAAGADRVASRVLLEYADGSTSGRFEIPAGVANGWLRSDQRVAKFRNRAAPAGATQVHSLLVRRAKRLSMRAAGLGDVQLEVGDTPLPRSGVFVSVELHAARGTARLCSHFKTCNVRGPGADGATKLVCRHGVADGDCRAGRPVYWSGDRLAYGGEETVSVIGDSITVQASKALYEAAEGHRFMNVTADYGAMFCHQQAQCPALADSRPQAVVLHLGTNDLLCWHANVIDPLHSTCPFPGFDLDVWMADVDTMVATFEPETCLLGTTTWLSMHMNERWRELEAAGAIDGIVAWRETLEAMSEPERAELLTDGMGHLTDAGATALAQLTLDTVRAQCDGDPGAASLLDSAR